MILHLLYPFDFPSSLSPFKETYLSPGRVYLSGMGTSFL